ncbi:MAG TPA: VOC family protein [Burkholderiales bacterium]|nr:VOC family protein [Burkholderiales bacterium]
METGKVVDVEKIKAMAPPAGNPFQVQKIGHVVLNVVDVERSAAFYTGVLGFRISDVYPETMMRGGMVFMRCAADHHGVALVGSARAESHRTDLNHLAFEVASLDEVLLARDHLKKHGVRVVFEGRRRAGCQVAVEFLDPDGHHLEIYWGLDQIGSDGIIRPPEQWREHKSLEAAIADAPVGQDTSLRNPALLKARA